VDNLNLVFSFASYGKGFKTTFFIEETKQGCILWDIVEFLSPRFCGELQRSILVNLHQKLVNNVADHFESLPE